MQELVDTLPGWTGALLIVAAAIAIALVLHAALSALARRVARGAATENSGVVLRCLYRPTRWLFVALALAAVQPALGLDAHGLAIWRQVAGLVMPALLGWLVVAGLGAVNTIIQAGADMTVADNLHARRKRTRASILYRIAVFIVVLVAFCLMLMSIPSIRSVGVTLIASAGLAALAVGAAAQPALKNLIAGLQMAFTEPIRLDDVVIVDGEWGRVEDIRLTFVVIKLWDERRLVVPVARFLEESFQNWTRQTSQLLGAVIWYLDPATDIARLRRKLDEVVRASPRWDGRFFNLQVTDTRPEAIEVRALVTAKDASTTFDLRCEVREAVLAWLRADMPDAFPRRRGELSVQEPEVAAS